MRIHPFWLLVFMASPALAVDIEEIKLPANQAIIDGALEQMAENKKLPPCEGLNRNTALVLNRKIPKSCPNALAFQAHLKKLDAKIRSGCPARVEKISGYLRDSTLCEGTKDEAAALALHESGREMYAEWNQLEVDNFPDALTNEDCRLAWTLLYSYRKKQTDISSQLNNLGEIAIVEACSDPRAPQEFFNFLQRGDG